MTGGNTNQYTTADWDLLRAYLFAFNNWLDRTANRRKVHFLPSCVPGEVLVGFRRASDWGSGGVSCGLLVASGLLHGASPSSAPPIFGLGDFKASPKIARKGPKKA